MKKSTRSQAAVNPDQLSLDAPIAFVIYTLCDPRETDPIKRIRYVGVTHKTAECRLRKHIREAQNKPRGRSHTHKCNWIMSLLSEGLIPIVEVVDPGTACRKVGDSEISWIAYFRRLGCPLTNGTDGGEGVIGHKWTDEEREHIRQTRLGTTVSEETRQRMRVAQQEVASRQGMKERRAASIKKAHSTDEARARASERSKTRWANPDYREKMSAANKKTMQREDVRARKSKEMKERMSDPLKRATMQAAAHLAQSDPAVRQVMKEKVTDLWKDPVFKAKQHEARMAAWARRKAAAAQLSTANMKQPC